ncbi:zinc ribbon domain-containing protein [Methanobacterium spitsbergense]|uniref:Zinc ribbon domain-containing protein n=1 Tax=Methanobacterium spitsbergense TaxID=2874285 RepID=A0A8T5UYV0_9EURY|nr:zinc ribbon domain-containing protein [Methanobacterium spitsbergense]MBZ2165909.1 zinc ribbon domain-containing protein [Methanobacterium spitsbergense]
MKIKCSNCGHESEKNKIFCTECGTKIEQISELIESKQVINCPKCSIELPANTKFCTDCGTKIDQQIVLDQEIICPKCSKKLPANSKFCKECGTKIGFDNKSLNEFVSDETIDSIKERGKDIRKEAESLFKKLRE